jgi:hypothetical protein
MSALKITLADHRLADEQPSQAMRCGGGNTGGGGNK